jgi:hypothetical protein
LHGEKPRQGWKREKLSQCVYRMRIGERGESIDKERGERVIQGNREDGV